MSVQDDDARLLSLLRGRRADRKQGLRELFETRRAALFGLTLRMTGHSDLADDAVQETFVDVMHGIDGFRGESRLSTWLFRVAIRAATRVASRSSQRESVLPAELSSEATGSPNDPSRGIQETESAARILAAIAALPAHQRAVVALFSLDDMPQTEIATILGIPEGTVHSRLHKGRERLRESLGLGDQADSSS